MKIVAKDTNFLLISLRTYRINKNKKILNHKIFYELYPNFFIISKYAFIDKNDSSYFIRLEKYIKLIIENAIYREKLYFKQKLENNLTIKNKEKIVKI